MTKATTMPVAANARLARRTSKPSPIREAIVAGHQRPDAANPFPEASSLWEGFNLGQYLRLRGIPPEGFFWSSDSTYVDRFSRMTLWYCHTRHGWRLLANF